MRRYAAILPTLTLLFLTASAFAANGKIKLGMGVGSLNDRVFRLENFTVPIGYYETGTQLDSANIRNQLPRGTTWLHRRLNKNYVFFKMHNDDIVGGQPDNWNTAYDWVGGSYGAFVTGATNSTLTRSGNGTTASPYTLGLNLSNPNTWLAYQGFNHSVGVGSDASYYYGDSTSATSWRTTIEDNLFHIQHRALTDTIYSLVFDGVDDYVFMTDSASGGSFDFGTGSFTIEGWIKTHAVREASDEQVWWSSRPGAENHRVNLGIQVDKPFIVLDGRKLGGTYEHIIGYNAAITTNQWTHIAGVFDRSVDVLRLYKDGELVDTLSLPGFVSLTIDGTYYLGAINTNDAFFDGEISQVKVYKGTALTAAQIRTDMTTTTPSGATWASGLSAGTGTTVTPDVGTGSYSFSSVPVWKKYNGLTLSGPTVFGNSSIVVSDAGYVGIGSNSEPQSLFQVKGGKTSTIATIITDSLDATLRLRLMVGDYSAGQSNALIDFYKDGVVTWQAISRQSATIDRFEINEGGSTARMVINSGGWVGFGTTNPAYGLHVKGIDGSGIAAETDSANSTIRMNLNCGPQTGTSQSNTIMQFQRDDTTRWQMVARKSATIDRLEFNRSGTTRIAGFDTLGNFAVGNIDPTSRLDVSGCVEVLADSSYYIGDPSTDGSWRIRTSNGLLYHQKRVSGVWVSSAASAAVTAIDTSDTPYTVAITDYTVACDATGKAITVNLPAATGSGRIINVKKIDSSAYTVTVDANDAETIDGDLTKVIMFQWTNLQLQDAAAGVWYVL